MFDSRPQTVAFRIYGDSTDAPIRGTLASLLSGKKLTVRAFLAAGGHKEVTFDIEKGEHLIRRTLAIKGRRATEADLRDAEIKYRRRPFRWRFVREAEGPKSTAIARRNATELRNLGGTVRLATGLGVRRISL